MAGETAPLLLFRVVGAACDRGGLGRSGSAVRQGAIGPRAGEPYGLLLFLHHSKSARLLGIGAAAGRPLHLACGHPGYRPSVAPPVAGPSAASRRRSRQSSIRNRTPSCLGIRKAGCTCASLPRRAVLARTRGTPIAIPSTSRGGGWNAGAMLLRIRHRPPACKHATYGRRNSPASSLPARPTLRRRLVEPWATAALTTPRLFSGPSTNTRPCSCPKAVIC